MDERETENGKGSGQEIYLIIIIIRKFLSQSYLDPTNIRGKLQKHGNFEQELRANRNRLDEIKSTGQELIQSGHYANEHIQVN